MRAPYDRAPKTVAPKDTSQEGSPLQSGSLESSTIGSVSSSETEMSEFRRTLETARATAEKAAQLQQKERDVLEELGRVPLEDVPFSSDHTLPERDTSSGSASSLQSDELVSVSTPSTLSLSVTLSSDLSVTAGMSRTTQSGTASRDTGFIYPSTSQIRSHVSDVTDSASITAATSLLTKTTQSIGFSRPLLASARHFSVLPSGPEPYARISSGLPYIVPSSETKTELTGRNPLAFASSSSGSVQPRTIGVSQPSAVQPPTRSDYSPGYLDFYYQKIEEERQLFEAQRNRIRRYSDLYKKNTPEGPGTQTYQTSRSTGRNVPPTELLLKTSPYVLDQYGGVPTYLERKFEDTNKENQGYIANLTGFRGQDRLQEISQRLSAFEKSMTTGTTSTVVTSSSYASKPLSTSDWSRGSSTEYMSLPRESAGAGARGSAGSTLSSLSELTEMMTRLTSTSDESDVTSSKSRDTLGATRGQSSGFPERQAGYAPERDANAALGLSVGSSPLTGLDGNLIFRGSPREQLYVPSSVVSSETRGPLASTRSYVPMEKSTKSSGPGKPLLSAPGSRWTRGSDGKQWFVLSRSHTLSSGGGLLEKDIETPGEVGVDSVFPDTDEDKSKST